MHLPGDYKDAYCPLEIDKEPKIMLVLFFVSNSSGRSRNATPRDQKRKGQPGRSGNIPQSTWRQWAIKFALNSTP